MKAETCVAWEGSSLADGRGAEAVVWRESSGGKLRGMHLVAKEKGGSGEVQYRSGESSCDREECKVGD